MKPLFPSLILFSLFYFKLILSIQGQQIPQHYFIENKGQVSDQNYQPRTDVLFYGETVNAAYYLKNNGISYQFSKVDSWKEVENIGNPKSKSEKIPDELTIYRTDITWIGVNTDFTVQKGTTLPKVDNFYLANCPDGVTGIRSFESVTYQNIYDGIDLKWYDRNGQLEYDYLVRPGADYEKIQWIVGGAERTYINEQGELIIQTPFGEIREQSPAVFQANRQIKSYWKLMDNQVGFVIDEYDNNLPLLIDPVIATRNWCTYYGGTDDEDASGFAMDDSSNIYFAGFTTSPLYIATSGSFQNTLNGGPADAFIVKMTSSGIPVWATYYGGTDLDQAYGCTVDALHNVYLAGRTRSTSSISTPGSHQDTFTPSTNFDAFVVKFDQNGVRQWGTYYGGSGIDGAFDCITDTSLNVYLIGNTNSVTKISTPGAHQIAIGGNYDGFVVKFNSTGVRQWGSYYGGTGPDYFIRCSIDTSANVYISGQTSSTASVATTGSYQSTYGGNIDAFLLKIDKNGTRQWSTYYGGTNEEYGYDCVTDGSSNVYLAGSTKSSSAIATAGSHQPNFNGGVRDGFIAKFDNNGNRLWSTYYGGSSVDEAFGCGIDPSDNVYLTGHTHSDTGIATSGSFRTIYEPFAPDGFLVKFNSNGIRQWGTYTGSNGSDEGQDCFSDATSVYLLGNTTSDTGIATPGSYQTVNRGGLYDVYIISFNECSTTYSSVSPVVCDSFISPGNNFIYYTSGTYYDTLINQKGCDSVIIVELTIINDPDTLTFVSCDSITSPSGKYLWTNSGIYLDTITTSLGCDKITTVDLTIHSVNTAVIQTGNILTAVSLASFYQWVDCNDNFSNITGANNQIFTATENGNYAIIVSENGCTDTSECYEVTTIGLENSNTPNNVNIYPNPTGGRIIVDLGSQLKKVDITLSNMVGQVLDTWSEREIGKLELDIDQESGIYLLKVSTDNQEYMLKFVKN